MVTRRIRATAGFGMAAALGVLTCTAQAWDAPGHRVITWLALDNLPEDAPAFLRKPGARHAVGWQAAEPDRWRGVRHSCLVHENAPDHYLDAEDLMAFGLTLSTIDPLRYRFVRDMAVARHEHPTGPDEKAQAYDASKDPTGTKEWPGFVLHASLEAWGKLVAAMRTYRVLEKLNDPERAPQMEMTKANIMVQMGILSHWIGDMAQPLHTTKHFNGWAGDNPQGYTTDKKFHAYIDGGVLAHHGLTYAALKPGQKYERSASASDPWSDVVAHFERSFKEVEPLYQLEKSGDLNADAGKAFISERLHDGAAMLSAMYNAAWAASAITDQDVSDFVRYDGFVADETPPDARASKPAEPAADTPAPTQPKDR